MKKMLAVIAVVGIVALNAGLSLACGDERRINPVRESADGSAQLQSPDIIPGDVFVRESDGYNVQLEKFGEADAYNVPICTGLSCLPWVLLGRI